MTDGAFFTFVIILNSFSLAMSLILGWMIYHNSLRLRLVWIILLLIHLMAWYGVSPLSFTPETWELITGGSL